MEIEIKVKVENSSALMEELKRNGSLLYEDYQKDSYYTPAHRNFVEVSPVKEWLRVRDSNGKYFINYKKWIYDADGKSNHCNEHETGVVSLEEITKILLALDFKPLITVEKKRSAWKYEDYEISFDDVVDLGSFVEIEYKGKEVRDSKEITDEMIEFLKKHNVGEITRDFKGYPYLLLEQKHLL